MVKIFISYRRADSRKDAGRIYDRLIEAFGKENIFKDVDSIPLGKDFRGVLREAVARCDVQLVIIGRQWIDIQDEHGNRRLDNPGDFVRIEVESALQRDSCLVIPVLVDKTSMPGADDLPPVLRELAFKNATVVRDDPDFHRDVNKIISELKDRYQVRSQKSVIRQKVEAPGFNVHEAIRQFYEAFEQQNWEQTREILNEIRASDKAPRIFDIDAHEQEIWEAIEKQERDEQYNLLRLMAKRGNPRRVRDALQLFWQDFPDYDPDNIAAQIRPEQKSSPPSARPSRRKDPLELARQFTGTQNSDWTPVFQTFEVKGIPFEMCLVPVGQFQMGSDSSEASDSEKPVHSQTIQQPVWLGVHPVTNEQWRMAVEASSGAVPEPDWSKWYSDSSKARHPVVGVTWNQCQKLMQWLGDGWRLPTEPEWEFAARGPESLVYPFGNDFQPDLVVYKDNSGNSTAAVGGRPQGASWVGAQDMSGNVWEWLLSEYRDYPYKVDDGREHPTSDARRVLRGGSWNLSHQIARAAARRGYHPYFRFNYYGVRVVRPPSP